MLIEDHFWNRFYTWLFPFFGKSPHHSWGYKVWQHILDDNYMEKVADFGASVLVSPEQTAIRKYKGLMLT